VRITSPSVASYLDHVSAHIGEHARAMRACNGGGKIENANAAEASRQIALIVFHYGHSQTLLPRAPALDMRGRATLKREGPLGKLSATRAFH
jgi:hypothetical protein